MTDDIRSLTAAAGREPGSLAFLELAEALRRRGQLEAAFKVARGGLARYPGLADAHDLLARMLSDQGDLAGAFDAWADGAAARPDAHRRAQGHRLPLLSRRRLGRRARASPARRRGRSGRPGDPRRRSAGLARASPTAGRAGSDREPPAGRDERRRPRGPDRRSGRALPGRCPPTPPLRCYARRPDARPLRRHRRR